MILTQLHQKCKIFMLAEFSTSDLLKTLISLLVIINPLAAIPIYLALTEGLKEEVIKKVYRTASKSVFFVLAISALAGEIILKVLGISLVSFKIGGGILLAVIAFNMMMADNRHKNPTKDEEDELMSKGESIALVPLTIPLLTGPGSMSVCIITASKYPGFLGYIYILISAIVVAFIVRFVLKGAPKIKDKVGKSGMNVMTKVFSLFLMALAIELIGSGLGQMFPNWTHIQGIS